MQEPSHLLSVTTSAEGDVVTIHGDIAGLEFLRATVDRLLSKLQTGQCDHDHLRTSDWAGDELSKSMLSTERDSGHNTVHHLEVLAWTDEWKEKHGL
jgi:Immunity protein 32